MSTENHEEDNRILGVKPATIATVGVMAVGVLAVANARARHEYYKGDEPREQRNVDIETIIGAANWRNVVRGAWLFGPIWAVIAFWFWPLLWQEGLVADNHPPTHWFAAWGVCQFLYVAWFFHLLAKYDIPNSIDRLHVKQEAERDVRIEFSEAARVEARDRAVKEDFFSKNLGATEKDYARYLRWLESDESTPLANSLPRERITEDS